ncbi:hypothetical protein [Martelella alba]|uniref:Leucine rich repeat (LRR) protein n=1 Tax=Martelella alba TaxID=2590451 RepID=A0ABY2SLV4_9HYPH|nr:hypothetical protein [Martelella alba]TKI06050.1 hypothetical protein FCN80_11030 [Martelella alba]
MRLSEYFTCWPQRVIVDDGEYRLDDWAPDYDGEWVRWAKEAWFEEKRNRQVALEKLLYCLQHQQEELDLSHLGLRCLPLIPKHVKTLNAGHNKLTQYPFPYSQTLAKVDLSYNKIKDIPGLLPIKLKELTLTGNPLNEDTKMMYYRDNLSCVIFDEAPSVSQYHTGCFFSRNRPSSSLEDIRLNSIINDGKDA